MPLVGTFSHCATAGTLAIVKIAAKTEQVLRFTVASLVRLPAHQIPVEAQAEKDKASLAQYNWTINRDQSRSVYRHEQLRIVGPGGSQSHIDGNALLADWWARTSAGVGNDSGVTGL
jgi:hypothetical protein